MKYILFLLPLLVGCYSDDQCKGKDRILAIDETFSPARQEAIIAAAYTWQDAMLGTGVIFHPEVRKVEAEHDACTFVVVNEATSKKEVDGEAWLGSTSLTKVGHQDGTPYSSAIIRANENVSLHARVDIDNRMTNSEFETLALHEIGHALGLLHLTYNDHYSIMEPLIKDNMTIGSEEIEILCEIWQCNLERPTVLE